MKKPSPAMVVALVALTVALGGTAAAGTKLITGQQIKDHSIGLVDISTLAVDKLHGQRGPAGPPGIAGAIGDPGPSGGFDPAKVSYVQGPPANFLVGQVATVEAICPAGNKVLGGGVYSNITVVGSSRPLPDGSGWAAVLANTSLIEVDGLYAFAVCGAP